MTRIEELFKNLALAGVGAAAIGYEKAQALIEELIKRGEMTVEEGKVFNEELQRKLKKEPLRASEVDVARHDGGGSRGASETATGSAGVVRIDEGSECANARAVAVRRDGSNPRAP